jgi:3-hydroxyisobutyrate dehydrogenase-like beta-hydroxyacid dehydrogenase
MPSNEPIGIVGSGLMGTALSRRLIDAGMTVLGFDVDPLRCEELRRNGGTIAASFPDLASRCRTVIIAVYSAGQIGALFDELDNGAGSSRPVLICTTTCSPDEIIDIADRAVRSGFPFIEMPISGTSAEVGNGTATALVAGDTDRIETEGAILDVLCSRTVPVGRIGDASRSKLAINLILQANRAALAEGIVFAERMGLDGAAFLRAARASAAYSTVMETKGEKMLARDFRPQSRISQTLRDAELIIAEAKRVGLQLPITATQADLLRIAIAREGPDSDSAAVIEAIRLRPASKEAS